MVEKLSKCIGIISYFPDEPELRENRRSRCFKLLNQLNEHFKLPIFIVTQNWSDEDINELNKFTNQQIYITKDNKLGITGARIKLRDVFLNYTNFDYVILLDDDSDLVIEDGGVEQYLQEIDDHPNCVGLWNLSMPRLLAVSRYSYDKLGYDFIKDLDAEKLEVWEDHCWRCTYQQLWPDEVYTFKKDKMKEISLFSEGDPGSIYYHKWVNDPQDVKDARNRMMVQKCIQIIGAWKKHIIEQRKDHIKCSIIIPAYNSSKYITRCLDSIPSRKDIEVIVVDDCSTDDTFDVLNNYENRWGKFVKLKQDTNKGPGEARQRGLEISVGDRVYFADSDDWFITENFSRVMNYLYTDDSNKVNLIACKHEKNDGSIGTHVFEYSINNTFIDRKVLKGFRYSSGYFSEDTMAINTLMRLNNNHLTKGIVELVVWHYNIPREGSLTDIRHKVSRDVVNNVNSYNTKFEDVVGVLNDKS